MLVGNAVNHEAAVGVTVVRLVLDGEVGADVAGQQQRVEVLDDHQHQLGHGPGVEHHLQKIHTRALGRLNQQHPSSGKLPS